MTTPAGFQRIVSSQYLDGAVTADMSIPPGMAVVASGVSADVLNNAFASADGPHPTDVTKWRFQVSTVLQAGGGNGTPMTVHCWILVASQ